METVKNRWFDKTEARFKVLKLSPELLFSGLFRPLLEIGTDARWEARPEFMKGFVRCLQVKGWPKDAQIQASTCDFMTNQIWFRVWSAEFPVVEEGYVSPDLIVEITEHRFDVPLSPGELRKLAGLPQNQMEEVAGAPVSGLPSSEVKKANPFFDKQE